MSAVAVQIDTLTQRFDPKAPPALDGISATFYQGQTSGIIGPDGAGKTTLLRILAGLLRPQGGSCALFGIDVVSDADRIRPLMGYMPQQFGLYRELSVQQNLDLYADLHGIPDKKQRFQRLLDLAGLAPFTKRLARDLSGGMKQKLGLICCLIGQPKILVLDEPDVGVDPRSESDLWRMLQQLNAEGVTVVWSTSNLSRASEFDSILLLHKGQALFQGPPKQLTQEVEGKVFQVHGVGEHKRRLLVDLAQAGPILDATLQGDLVRVVTREENAQKGIEALCGNADYTIVPCPPRFEDAFINRLGGVQEHLQLDYQLPNGKSATPPVEARNLSKRFGSFTAVNQINFSMQRGEIFGLLGPNGAGKSTTFKMLCGLLKASSGDPFVEGIPMIQAPSHARAQIGYMAQGFSLYNNLTVLQNLRFFGGSYAVPNLGQRIDALLSTFGLIPYTDTYPKTLPLGLKQRLALCCALLHHPPILFLDEPTAGVDPLTRREFWLHINNLTRNGASVLVSTHLMDEAEFCDRIGFIYEGQLKVVGTPSELRAYGKSASTPNPTLTDAFLALCGTPEKQGGN